MVGNRADLDNVGHEKKQLNLSSLVVRPILPEEKNIWNDLMSKHHYLGLLNMPGKNLKYVGLLDGQWVALLVWGSAVLKSRCREQWIGWSLEQKTERLKYVVNNQRFLILPGIQINNLASKLLALNTKRLSSDWEVAYGHPVLIAETFVDHSRFTGTCYRAAGWVPLGKTSGFGRKGGIYYYHGETKTILIKPLHPMARYILSAPFPAKEIAGGKKALIDLNAVSIETKGGLLDCLSQMVDPRKKRGIRHKILSVMAIAICAILSGEKTFVAIGEWAADLSQDLLKRFGCRQHDETKKYIPPSEPTIRRNLQAVNADQLDRIIGEWIESQAEDSAIAVDGKVLKGSKGVDGKQVYLVSAFLQNQKATIGQVQVAKKSNEITAFRPLLEPLNLKGKVVTADAMHTQVKNAIFLVVEKGADYIFQVKQNQETLFETVRNLPKENFSCKFTTTEKGHGRIEKRVIWTTTAIVGKTDFPYVAQAIRVYRRFTDLGGKMLSEETSYYITSISGEKANNKRLLKLIRGHWSIENSSHYVRDVTFGEDRSQIRTGAGPRVMATLRNLATAILRFSGVKNISKGLRKAGRKAEFSLSLIGV